MIVFFFLSSLYSTLLTGAKTTTSWSPSLPNLSESTCNGGRVVGGWNRVCRSVSIISKVADFLVGTEIICLSPPYESKISVISNLLKSPPTKKCTSLAYLALSEWIVLIIWSITSCLCLERGLT